MIYGIVPIERNMNCVRRNTDLLEALNEPAAIALKHAELVFVESWLKMDSTFWTKSQTRPDWFVRIARTESESEKVAASAANDSTWRSRTRKRTHPPTIVAVGLVTRTNLDKHCYESELGNRCSKSWYWRKPMGWRMVNGRITIFLLLAKRRFCSILRNRNLFAMRHWQSYLKVRKYR